MVSTGSLLVGINVRASTVLGVVGAGGIGQELKTRSAAVPRLLTIILIILAMRRSSTTSGGCGGAR
jgi:phosphonate transport system permease protein